ncbi:two-component system QseEF-associated lipoprotein QseG [Pantoea coffeiphila]|uniref:Two-component system QseEF-associated lipoprotein QseG n=1 Tax=Pantoea coffeiphila TaxID=1465635 RepID=A0A2S9IAU8_9GAMM|nr:two-component system QseEF-associated lipoprotein QseG [Pantoea coffeiphila]PRD14920.1 two-component system QseEF-associated lipoprotein QseG [Pantoea coffeiphila]
MRFSPLSALLYLDRTGKLAAVSLLTSLISGCSQMPEKNSSLTHDSFSETERRVVDFQAVSCGQVWTFNSVSVVNNPLYWLRAMDCAERLTPAEARAEARRWPADNWQSRFKQAVLLSNGNITPVERRQYLQRLDDYSYDYPTAVRPLLTLWREGQGSLLQLSAERTRYATLQQTSDAQLDALRQQDIALNQELAVTRRKLDSLTDIERQLSSRRSPDATDSSHAADKSAPDDVTSSGNKSEDDATP